MSKIKMKKYLDGFQQAVLVVPSVLLICVFVLYPFIMGVFYSFTNWNNTPIFNWVGFENYMRLFKDTTFVAAIKNTLLYGVAVPVLLIPVGLTFASMLNAKSLKLRGILRTMIYLPGTLALLIVSLTFRTILWYEGILDQIWLLLGNDKAINIMSSAPLSQVIVIIVIFWAGLGGNVVFFLAGLQGIPEEVNEAAMVDGANALQRFFRITLPMLRPTIMIVTFIAMNGALKMFDLPFLMTKGGPGTATISVAMLIYQQAFTFNTAGYATTTGIILLIVVAILAVLQMKVTGGREDAV